MHVRQKVVIDYLRNEIRQHREERDRLLIAFNKIRDSRNTAALLIAPGGHLTRLDEKLKESEEFIQISCQWFAAKVFELDAELQDAEKGIEHCPNCLQLKNIKDGKQGERLNANTQGVAKKVD
jgi:hypothetical protein